MSWGGLQVSMQSIVRWVAAISLPVMSPLASDDGAGSMLMKLHARCIISWHMVSDLCSARTLRAMCSSVMPSPAMLMQLHCQVRPQDGAAPMRMRAGDSMRRR